MLSLYDGVLGRRPSGKATGLLLKFLKWQAQLEGDRAATTIWELEVFWWQVQWEGDRAATAI